MLYPGICISASETESSIQVSVIDRIAAFVFVERYLSSVIFGSNDLALICINCRALHLVTALTKTVTKM